MPTQEDRVLTRIRVLGAYIRDAGEVTEDQVFAWALVNQGIRDRTVALYLKSMRLMGLLIHDSAKRTYVWVNPGQETKSS